MDIEVVCYGAMRDYLPAGSDGRRTQLRLDDGADVAELIERFGAPPRLVVSVLVGDERAERDRVLREGDRVTLMPPFTGG
jgi:molybdopterin converting factor small subunit